eukprot:7337-Heterococcus_DN1.PRE.1
MSSGIACKTPVAISSIMLAQGWLDCYSSESNLEQSVRVNNALNPFRSSLLQKDQDQSQRISFGEFFVDQNTGDATPA